MPEICVRFAPSPTGWLHIGGLRTALFNWLFARQHQGKFILRIEDTDRARFVPGAVENIIDALHWYGLDFDEGPVYQSQRLPIYKKYVDQLVAEGHAYHCFCTAERLAEVRKVQEVNRQVTKYDGFCRSLTDKEVQKNLAGNKPYVVRLKVSTTGQTEFSDMIYGSISVDNTNIDDQVLLKSDGYPTYHLANVVDDHEQGVTHVIRAEEWLPSTPKHIILYQAFGWSMPIFAHIPMVLGTDRSKLSKRHGAVSALEYREQGYLPEAVINFIALLGWNPKTDKEVFTRQELIKEFSLDKVNKASAIFNLEKLDWLNGFYIRQMKLDDLVSSCRPFLGDEARHPKIKNIVALFHERLKKLSEIKDLTGFFFADKLEYRAELLVPKKADKIEVNKSLSATLEYLKNLVKSDFTADRLKDNLTEFIKKEALSNTTVLWPLRVAVTGLAASPGVFDVMAVLGQEEVIKRLQAAQKLLNNT